MKGNDRGIMDDIKAVAADLEFEDFLRSQMPRSGKLLRVSWKSPFFGSLSCPFYQLNVLSDKT